MAGALGCKEGEVLPCLQATDYRDIIQLTYNLTDRGTLWQAVPDSSFTTAPFLHGDPEDLLQSGEFLTDVEVVIGTTRDEGLLYLLAELQDPAQMDELRENWAVLGPALLLDIGDPGEVTPEDLERSNRIIDFYVGGVSNIDMEHLQGLSDMFTDSGFLYGVYKTVQHLVAAGVPVHQYLLTHRGQYSLTQLFAPGTVRSGGGSAGRCRWACAMRTTCSTCGPRSATCCLLPVTLTGACRARSPLYCRFSCIFI
jgi:carboxylesterase type B